MMLFFEEELAWMVIIVCSPIFIDDFSISAVTCACVAEIENSMNISIMV